MKLKGKITLEKRSYSLSQDEEVWITCCNRQPNVRVDGRPVYDLLQDDSGCHQPPSREDVDEKDWEPEVEKKWNVRYVIRDTPFTEDEDFETVAATAQIMALESSIDRGCYSEWTCGTGGYEFLFEGGHSILVELASHVGKYVWAELGDPAR